VVIQAFYHAQISVSGDRKVARNPLLHIASTVRCKRIKPFATKADNLTFQIELQKKMIHNSRHTFPFKSSNFYPTAQKKDACPHLAHCQATRANAKPKLAKEPNLPLAFKTDASFKLVN